MDVLDGSHDSPRRRRARRGELVARNPPANCDLPRHLPRLRRAPTRSDHTDVVRWKVTTATRAALTHSSALNHPLATRLSRARTWLSLIARLVRPSATHLEPRASLQARAGHASPSATQADDQVRSFATAAAVGSAASCNGAALAARREAARPVFVATPPAHVFEEVVPHECDHPLPTVDGQPPVHIQ